MLFAFVTIVMGSQQLLVLPNDRPLGSEEESPMGEKDGREPGESETQLEAVIARLRNTSHDNHPNAILIFALQAPIMLLTLSVLAFLVGLASVIFAPLARQLVWDDSAKVRRKPAPERSIAETLKQIALYFGIGGVMSIVIFISSSFLLHGLFSLQTLENTPKIVSWAGKWKPAPL